MNDVKRIWAWCFDQVDDPKVKALILSNYIRELHYHDRHSAEELSLWLHLYEPSQTTFGEQLTLDYGQEETRI